MDPRTSLLNNADIYINYVNKLSAIVDSTLNSINEESTVNNNDELQKIFKTIKSDLARLRNDITLILVSNRPLTQDKKKKFPSLSIFSKHKSQEVDPSITIATKDLEAKFELYKKIHESFIGHMKDIVKHVEMEISEAISAHDMAVKLAADLPEEKLIKLSNNLTNNEDKQQKIDYFDLQKQAKSSKHEAFIIYKHFKALANKVNKELKVSTNLNVDESNSDIKRLFQLKIKLFKELNVVTTYNRFIRTVENMVQTANTNKNKHFTEDKLNPAKEEITETKRKAVNNKPNRRKSVSSEQDNSQITTAIPTKTRVRANSEPGNTYTSNGISKNNR